jgi:hypothetical protein
MRPAAMPIKNSRIKGEAISPKSAISARFAAIFGPNFRISAHFSTLIFASSPPPCAT